MGLGRGTIQSGMRAMGGYADVHEVRDADADADAERREALGDVGMVGVGVGVGVEGYSR
jgi:hypothetical protein